jgi:hypothetical protein
MNRVKLEIERIIGASKEDKKLVVDFKTQINVLKKGTDDKSKDTLITLIHLFDRESLNKLLKNYKRLYEVFGGDATKVFNTETSEKFLLQPYTSLEDIREYKSKFVKTKSAPASARNSNSDTGSGQNIPKHPYQLFPTPFNAIPHQFIQHNQMKSMHPPFNANGYPPRGPNNMGHGNRGNYQRPNGGYGNRGNYNQRPPQNNGPRIVGTPFPMGRPDIPRAQAQAGPGYETVEQIEANLSHFKGLGKENQRNYFGRLVHAEVDRQSKTKEEKNLVPRITGMLIDLEVFSVEEIITLLKDAEELRERIQEATELINKDGSAN